jgi:hypothetical protein
MDNPVMRMVRFFVVFTMVNYHVPIGQNLINLFSVRFYFGKSALYYFIHNLGIFSPAAVQWATFAVAVHYFINQLVN